jgi:hypothetical protein
MYIVYVHKTKDKLSVYWVTNILDELEQLMQTTEKYLP